MGSHPVRVPENVYIPLRAVAGLIGETPGTVIETAFFEYLERHQQEFTEIYQKTAKFLSTRDIPALADLAAAPLLERAKASRRTIEAARSVPPTGDVG